MLDGLANSVVATMKLQRVASTDLFTEFLNELKEIIKNPDYRNKFDTFLRRYLSVIFDNDKYNHINTLEEIIKMTKSFRDYDRENDKEIFKKEGIKEGRKEGEFNALYKIIKQGLLTVEQAAKSLGLTKKQLLAGFKQYNLAL